MLIELIFRGLVSVLDFNFLKDFLTDAKDVRFNFPEGDFSGDFDKTLITISSNSYVDLAISTDYLDIRGETISRVFINLSRDNDNIEVLFFFNLIDLKGATPKLKADYLKSWSEEFQKTYSFEYFICQIDNADQYEYYFDSNGIGKLYNSLN